MNYKSYREHWLLEKAKQRVEQRENE